VNNAKILGITISSDLKWKVHVEKIVSKATKRLYLTTQLKRAKVPIEDIDTNLLRMYPVDLGIRVTSVP
jgi:hypothetical protein